MTTRKSVGEDLAFHLKSIANKLQHDVNDINELVTRIENWVGTDPQAEYKAEAAQPVTELLLGLTNNSGWISKVGSAIYTANGRDI